MENTNEVIRAENNEAIGSLPIPFTIEEFRKDILNVYFHHVRMLGWMNDAESAWRSTGFKPEDQNGIFDPDYSADELGLSYDQIQHFQFARNMEHFYNFGFFGKLDASFESMEDGTSHTWAAAMAYDTANGVTAAEWDAYGADVSSSGSRCVMVAELANARHMLEGGHEWFFHFTSASKKEDAVAIDGLTVKQMALLAGMEEMSVRAAANPKRANPLKTFSEDGSTRIAFDVAKEWLQSKGRYVPITKFWAEGDDLDLANRRFKELHSLVFALRSRLRSVLAKSNPDDIQCRLSECGLPSEMALLGADDSVFADEQKMRCLANALDLPPDLLVLRCKETIAIEQLARVEYELKQLQNTSASANK